MVRRFDLAEQNFPERNGDHPRSLRKTISDAKQERTDYLKSEIGCCGGLPVMWEWSRIMLRSRVMARTPRIERAGAL
jgi:hypothetical protein